ncbi:hypothetical protein D3C80_1879670 [compost metagenome]
MQALTGQREVHRGGGVDHHGVRTARQQRLHFGETLGDAVLAGQFAKHLWAAGTEQRGDSLVAREQR